ncbi:ABC-type nitrate/sulfonate/bicarbonate transportsystem, ATPase component [Halodesulfurarchaeum formicicum]|uniref:ABC-type nitrate/sulfonate/bicarbonate transportsystem, ATPase component n=2 Tax=Halodesulfurarchaeum formicicum TaxID=1873524 RepID=A0A1J1ADX6_9EURY|nr:ABC-type nitrate/sulfonate/bicarbonate transportsystem, ATPase component [Halodesulfurarchaeum formicicum]
MATMTANHPSPGTIRFDRVEKTYQTTDGGYTTAVADVSLTVEPGELLTVVGPSGCGKTTLIRLVAGLEAPTAGRVQVDGTDVPGPAPERPVVFQEPRLFPWLTARENVAFGLRETDHTEAKIRQRAAEQLKSVGLGDAGGAYPTELSGGMKQRVGLARALAVQPPVLLMDEPFGSVDAHTSRDLQDDLLSVWSRTERTVLFVTHDIGEAVYLGDRVVVMGTDPGHIRETVTVDVARPRDRTDPALADYRERILELIDGN